MGIALFIAIAWQIGITIIGILIELHQSPDGTISGIFQHTDRWDAGWYRAIATQFYNPETGASPASPAFYPLFPLLVVIVQNIFFQQISLIDAGVIVNTVALWLALAAILKIGRHFSSSKLFRLGLVFFVLVSPAAFFLHMFYGEAVFIALGFWAYLFALERKWVPMAILLAFLTAARLPSLLFIGLCALELMRAYRWKLRDIINRYAVWFLLTPLGFITYGLLLWVQTGDFLAMFHAYSTTQDWTYQTFNLNIVGTVIHEITTSTRQFVDGAITKELVTNHLLPLSGLFVLLATSLYALIKLKGKFVPLGIFGLVAFVLFTLNSNVVSVHRYILPCLVIYLVFVAILEKKPRLYVVAILLSILSILIQLGLMYFFIDGHFAG